MSADAVMPTAHEVDEAETTTDAATPANPLVLGEELTIYHAAEQRTTLLAALAAHPEGLALDLGEVAEIDSAGVQLLLAAHREGQLRQQPLRIARTSAAVDEVFTLMGLSDFFADSAHSAAADTLAGEHA